MITGPRDTLKLARKLRSEMSVPEAMLWRELRKRPGGFKFRRQHLAGRFILDFYCHVARLAIEVDGTAHDGAQAVRRDRRRSEWLRSQGVGTTRIPAPLILKDMQSVISRIEHICRERAGLPSNGDGNRPQFVGNAVSESGEARGGSVVPVPLHPDAARRGPPPPVGEEL